MTVLDPAARSDAPMGPAVPLPPEFRGVIDTMIGFPHPDMKQTYAFLTAQTRDRESKEDFEFPVEYMFHDVPEKALRDVDDPVALTVGEMDRWGIAVGVIGAADPVGERALREHPDRFVATTSVDPNDGVAAIRRIRDEHERFDTRGVGVFPAGCNPPVPIGDRRMWPVYSTCCELGIPVFVCAGIPGPRVRFAAQHVEMIDDVMYDFPELTFVTRHGCEPWTDLIVKLMIKWPGLHYSTTAFAPKYYPQAIVDYANTRGADKVLYGGYFPMGLSLERLMGEMPRVGLRDEVWPKFLRGNAARLLGLDP